MTTETADFSGKPQPNQPSLESVASPTEYHYLKLLPPPHKKGKKDLSSMINVNLSEHGARSNSPEQ